MPGPARGAGDIGSVLTSNGHAVPLTERAQGATGSICSRSTAATAVRMEGNRRQGMQTRTADAADRSGRRATTRRGRMPSAKQGPNRIGGPKRHRRGPESVQSDRRQVRATAFAAATQSTRIDDRSLPSTLKITLEQFPYGCEQPYGSVAPGFDFLEHEFHMTVYGQVESVPGPVDIWGRDAAGEEFFVPGRRTAEPMAPHRRTWPRHQARKSTAGCARNPIVHRTQDE
jgi:hypothetical protein